MIMSAKTPGLTLGQRKYGPAKTRRQQLAVFPPLLVNIGPRASLMEPDDQNYESLLFGPGGAMFLPTDPSNDVQPAQPLNQLQGLQASQSTIAASSSLVFQLQSLASGVSSNDIAQPSISPPPSTTRTLLTDTPSQIPTSAPSPKASTAISNELTSTSQSQAQSLSESQTQAGLMAASASSAMSNGVTLVTAFVPCIPLILDTSNLPFLLLPVSHPPFLLSPPLRLLPRHHLLLRFNVILKVCHVWLKLSSVSLELSLLLLF